MFYEKERPVPVRVLTTAATAIALISSLNFASAQEEQEDTAVRTLDQVIVTARKREENLVTVPLSVSVVSGADLDRLGVQRLDEALQGEPAVSVTPTPVGDLLFIRGIGSGQNQGFEMSVGTFVDGVHYGRGRSSRHAFLDVESIEVLKGPQPILFGKNTTSGAFNIQTRKPTGSPEAYVDVRVEPEFGTYQLTGVVSGPLTDNLLGRVVLKSFQTDGYVDNTFDNRSEPSREDLVGRGTLVWTPTEDLEITFKGEYGDGSMEGGRSQISRASPFLQQLIAPVDPGATYTLDHKKSGSGTIAPFDREYEDDTIYNGTLTVDWDVGDHTLTSISSYVGFDVGYSFDADFTPLNFLHQKWSQHWHSWAQELRLASPGGRTFEYTGGIYMAKEKFKNSKDFAIDFSQTPLPFGRTSRIQNFSQETDTWSLFAEGTWNLTDSLSAIVGYRHTEDEKKANKELYWAQYGTKVPDPSIVLYTGIGLGAAHFYNGIERSTDDDSLAFTLRYKPNNVMYYASYTQGFKAGGFDESDITGVLNNINFDDETVNSYEIGLKADSLGGRMRTQAAIFYNQYDDLQVSQFDGVATLIVGNAAEAISSGVEVQTQFAATDRLTLSLAATYLDAYYDQYAGGPCAFGQGTVCDLSGKTLTFSPELSGAVTARWEDDFANGWRYTVDGKVFATSEFYTEADLDPFVKQGSFAKVDASVTLTSPDDVWQFSLIGKNLTDETTFHFANDIPLSNILGNNYQTYVDPPRTIALQARYRFR